MKSKTKLIFSCLAFIFLMGNVPVNAAETITLPNGTTALKPPVNTEAGLIDKMNKLDFQYLKENKNKTEDVKINDTRNDHLKETPAVLITQKFKVNSVAFSGNTVFDNKILAQYTQNIINKEITLDDIKLVTQNITNLYREKGYITSFAYIPAQKLHDGVLQVNILEGKIGSVKIEGNKWARTNYIRHNILESNNLKNNQILNVSNINNSVQQMNETEYLKGQVTIQKGTEQGDTDVILKIKEAPPFGIDTSYNNTGRSLVGVQKASITLSDYNLTGFGDSINISPTFASRTFGLNTGYTLPTGLKDTYLKFNYSLSKVHLGKEYKNDDIVGDFGGYSIGLDHALYKGNKLKVNSGVYYDFENSDTVIKGLEYQKSNLQILRTGINSIFDDNHGRFLSDFTVSTALYNKGTDNSNMDRFVKICTNLTRYQYLPFNTIAIARLQNQYTPSHINSVEQFQLGGMYSVRGFNEGALLGDVGYNLSLELMHAVPYLPEKINIPYSKGKKFELRLKNRINFSTFYDQGFAKDLHQGTSSNYTNFIQSVGAGIKINLSKTLMANFYLGVPLGRQRFDDQNSVKFHFNVSSFFY